MVLPVTAGVRLAMAIAKHAGKKLVKKGTRGYKLSNRLVKSKKARTLFVKSTTTHVSAITKRSIYDVKSLASKTKRHLKFSRNIIKPHLQNPLGLNKQKGKSFHHLITRPTFGEGQTRSITTDLALLKSKKPRKILAKAGIYGAYGYGASKLRS